MKKTITGRRKNNQLRQLRAHQVHLRQLDSLFNTVTRLQAGQSGGTRNYSLLQKFRPAPGCTETPTQRIPGYSSWW